MNGIERRPLSIKLRAQIIMALRDDPKCRFLLQNGGNHVRMYLFSIHHIAKERSVMAEDGDQ